MKRKIFRIIFALVLVMSLSLVAVVPVVAATPIYVNATTGSDLNDGQAPGTAVATITKGIQLVDSGGTVYVAAGTYTNDIWDSSALPTMLPWGYRITKSITLLGAQAGNDPAGSTDRGGESILVRTNGVPYSLYASDITIDGFTFTSGGGSGGGRIIVSDYGDGAIIRNSIIKDISVTDPHGIYIYPGAENILIEYNTLSNTTWEAIRCDGEVEISNNTIKDIPGNKGIYLGASSNAEIRGNTISNTFYEGIQAWAPVTITNNDISGGYHGIQLNNAASGSVIDGNTISGPDWIGIQSWASVDITNNVISGGWGGIEIMSGAGGSTMSGNTVSGTTAEAFRIFAQATISNNDISGGYHGIQLDNAASGSVIDGNTISSPDWIGIQSWVPVDITDNVISGGWGGIEIMSGAGGSTMSGNTVSGTTAEAFRIFAQATITNNDISGGYSGIGIWADGTVIDGNNIHDNQYQGVSIFNSVNNATIKNNLIINNPYPGVMIWGDGQGSGILINFNEITGNGYFGVESQRTTSDVDAEYNWWGDVSGPWDPSDDTATGGLYNPDGTGNKVSDYVDYEPWIGQGGMVTGGGWIMSPTGAYTPDISLSGKATFGFVSMYKKGAAVPTGNTQFNFQVADLNFHSNDYDWLVIAGKKAMYKGTGTINGAGDYGFILSAIDDDTDKFRIKIQDKATNTVIYDNKVDGENGTNIAGGRIVIHKGKNK